MSGLWRKGLLQQLSAYSVDSVAGGMF